MAKNKMAGNHPSYDKLNMSEASKKRKLAYDKEFQKTPARVKYRVELNKANRDSGTYGNGDKKDKSHSSNGKLTSENQKSNRGRNGHDGKSTIRKIK